MTRLADELIAKSLDTVDKEMVCRVCVGERNNDCNDCYLSNGKMKGGEG